MEKILVSKFNFVFGEFCKISYHQRSFDADFDQFEDNSYAIANKKVSQTSSVTLGIVVYAEPSFYSTDLEINEDLHLPGLENIECRDVYRQMFSKLFKDFFNKEVDQIVFGHEHGTTNGKCHLQICLTFKEPFRGTVYPFMVSFESVKDIPSYFDSSFLRVKLLFMAQRARRPNALAQYCMKDGKFFYLDDSKAIKYVYKMDKKGEPTDKINAFATVVANRSLLDVEQAKNLILTHDPRTGIVNYRNIEIALTSELCPSVPCFEWSFPEHMKGKYPLIEKWFSQWCIPEDLKRRKGLLLYSQKRCLGKTEFALSLVNHESYYVIFRNSFVDCLKGKTPKLLVLDDMAAYTTANKETWKALVSGQSTAIRDCFVNCSWNYRVPCIITTNNIFLVQQLMKSSEFNTQIIFQEISEYMGPPGTQPESMDYVEKDFSSETLEKVDLLMKESEEKFLKKKMERDLPQTTTEIMKLAQENAELKNIIKNLKNKK